MDGNGRWASGCNRASSVIKKSRDGSSQEWRCSKNMGVQVLTVYAFSTENWTRPERWSQVHHLPVEFYDRFVPNCIATMSRFKWSVIPRNYQKSSWSFGRAEEWPINTGLIWISHSIMVDVLSHSGREKQIAQEVLDAEFGQKISQEMITWILSIPRIAASKGIGFDYSFSGEIRLIIFLPWQAAYSGCISQMWCGQILERKHYEVP